MKINPSLPPVSCAPGAPTNRRNRNRSPSGVTFHPNWPVRFPRSKSRSGVVALKVEFGLIQADAQCPARAS